MVLEHAGILETVIRLRVSDEGEVEEEEEEEEVKTAKKDTEGMHHLLLTHVDAVQLKLSFSCSQVWVCVGGGVCECVLDHIRC